MMRAFTYIRARYHAARALRCLRRGQFAAFVWHRSRAEKFFRAVGLSDSGVPL